MGTKLRLAVSLLVLSLLAPALRADSPEADSPRGWLGVFLDTSGRSNAASSVEGVRVRGVVDGSPADEARIRAKDAIVAVNGTAVNSAPELLARVRDLEPGSLVKLSVKRAGHDLELSTVLGTRSDAGNRFRMVRGRLGVEAIELPTSLREHFGAPDDAGVLVSGVSEGSPADLAGIRIGDVLYEADGEPVASVADLSEIVTAAGIENTIDVVLARDGARIIVGPRIERAP